jgi:hypothetical protein
LKKKQLHFQMKLIESKSGGAVVFILTLAGAMDLIVIGVTRSTSDLHGHTCIHHGHKHARMHASTHTHTHTGLHMHSLTTHKHASQQSATHSLLQARTHARTHTRTCTRTRTHTHTRTHTRPPLWDMYTQCPMETLPATGLEGREHTPLTTSPPPPSSPPYTHIHSLIPNKSVLFLLVTASYPTQCTICSPALH